MSSQAATGVKPSRPGLARAGLCLALCAVVMTAAGCKAKSPSGQVVATVNGKEITGQDLLSEARGSGAKGRQDPRVLLQRVIARQLLAQFGHEQKVDAYPGYPSDLLRLQQDFLAQKALQSVVKPPPPPSASDIAAFEAAHPYVFAKRMRIQTDQIRFQTNDDLKSLAGAADMKGLVSRLTSLNTPFDRQDQTLDTAELPAALADKIVAAPIGDLLLIREGDKVLGMQVQSRVPVNGTADQQAALATKLITAAATQRQVDDQVRSLHAQAKIVYQPGFAPPASASGAPPAASATPPVAASATAG
jgi:peptidyl-prolyl cis-trans isomerase C